MRLFPVPHVLFIIPKPNIYVETDRNVVISTNNINQETLISQTLLGADLRCDNLRDVYYTYDLFNRVYCGLLSI